jgi:glycosyltransferase involved in cell wall biosynthesis
VKILLCHNFYRSPGGEDQVYQDEGWLLEQHGHEVIRFERDNHAISGIGRITMAKTALWSKECYQQIFDLVKRQRPEVVHFHNTFPLISASGYYAAQRAGAAVVQTMHNFRTICPGSTLLRNNAVCEKCVTKTLPLPSVIHKCYHDSRSASAVVAISSAYHSLRGTRKRSVNRYIALTNHSREIFITGGFPPEKIAVKPNFVRPDPGVIHSDGDYAVFVGRLSIEKGVSTLLEAWERLGRDIPLRVIGDGPLNDDVLRAQRKLPQIVWLGRLPFDRVLEEVGRARVLVCPSIWYETFGRSMIEAFATGTPVLASDIGSMQELVTDGKTGLHFRAGDAGDLAAKISKFFDDPAFFNEACKLARAEYEQRYTAEKNYQMLMAIYAQATADFASETGRK